MSIGQRFEGEEVTEASVQELFEALGAGDTPQMFEQQFDLVTNKDVPAGGGNSLDRKRVYLDSILYAEIMTGMYDRSGLTPKQIVGRIVEHEHSEIVLSQGDNPVDVYLPCHRRALRLEHLGVLAILGTDNAVAKIRNYEEVLWPGLVRCYHRPIKNPPRDLWCGVYLDHPDERDEQILRDLARFGVLDATKRSKYETHYGFGGNHCEDCSMWSPEQMTSGDGHLAMCTAVSGLVRDCRECDLWMERKSARSTSTAMGSRA